MEEEKKPDGTGLQNPPAPAEGVKPTAEDLLAELKARDEKIAKLSQDRDNYRTGMLKYKKEYEANPDDKTLEEEKIRQIFKEELLNTDLARAMAEKDAFVQKIAKENQELKIAMQNKSQISNMPGGSSQPENDTRVEQLTEEQRAHFEKISKEIGVKIDPAKFLDNWNKSKLK